MTARQNRLLILKGAIFVLLMVLILLFSKYGPQPLNVLEPVWEELHDSEKFHSGREKMGKFLVSFGPYASAAFVLLQAFQVVASPLPGELTGAVGGYVFGKTYGFLLSTIGLTLGSWLAFELARILGRPLVERFVRAELRQKFTFLTTNTGATISFLLFLLPGFPKDYLSYILGLSPMRLSTFLVVSTIGRIPGTYLLTIQGASIRDRDYLMALVFAGISVAMLFIAYLYRDRLFQWIKSEKVG